VTEVPGKDAPKTESWEGMQRGVTEPRVVYSGEGAGLR
jgi:hypothetical protein